MRNKKRSRGGGESEGRSGVSCRRRVRSRYRAKRGGGGEGRGRARGECMRGVRGGVKVEIETVAEV